MCRLSKSARVNFVGKREQRNRRSRKENINTALATSILFTSLAVRRTLERFSSLYRRWNIERFYFFLFFFHCHDFPRTRQMNGRVHAPLTVTIREAFGSSRPEESDTVNDLAPRRYETAFYINFHPFLNDPLYAPQRISVSRGTVVSEEIETLCY